MPPNFSLNEAAIFSDTDRSIEVYQTTLPSFFAASISCGVIASGGGASARAGEANTVPSASAVEACSEPCSTSRLESFRVFIASSASSLLAQSLYRLSARQRSGGSVSQTSVPLGTAVSVGVVTRNAVPSAASTM